MPELSNIENLKRKVVSNLKYFNTNYLFLFAIFFLTVFFFEPLKMINIVIVLALVFGAQYHMSLHENHVKEWTQTHFTAVVSTTFVIAMFFQYQVFENTKNLQPK